ncbi:MAG: DNA polymerase III subunit gamma/tau [Planctomycetota bacterium]|nr:MAG: DNA polymerase III subunit gamma/tau [Planctomycetota bacterium]
MTYRVLARKYRPRTFAEVKGQDHIVKALSRAIERDRVGQAYLLVGPRGVGKTSTARIFAKSLNCERGPTLEPCLACPPCREIELGGDTDVVEIDGASNNSVDDVRALRDRVHYQPLRDRRKVYIIDEVQRLSGPAFDALLKTLEEPPGHALFLFATTDPHKIPETIVSRCQVFEFRRLREEDVKAKLAWICAQEGREPPEEVIAALSRGCRGGLRDAESMLDQLLAVADGEPTLDDLELVAGLARPERWLDLLEAVERDDAPALLHAVDEFLARGGTERDFVEQATDAVRDILHVALLGEDALGVQPAPQRRERMQALARALGRDRLEALLGLLFSLETRMSQAPLAARALLEWTLLRAARLRELLGAGALLDSLRGGGGSSGGARTAPVPAAAVAPAPAPAAAPAAPADRGRLARLLEEVGKSRPTLGAVLRSNLVEGQVEERGVRLTLRPLEARDRSMLEDPVERAFLRDLPGSPGEWSIAYAGAERRSDGVGERLREFFGGVEESP